VTQHDDELASRPHEPMRPEDELIRARQRERARLMAWLLGAFVILMFLITIAKMGLAK
jgi:hypothetical protein